MTTLTLITRHGPLDLCFAPAGFSQCYEQLVEHSVVITLAGADLPVAALEDVVASKRAAGRPKDVAALPALEAHLRRGQGTRGHRVAIEEPSLAVPAVLATVRAVARQADQTATTLTALPPATELTSLGSLVSTVMLVALVARMRAPR